MKIKRIPAGFVAPAQPIKASKPPSGPDWVHEIKHDGYRLIVRRDGPTVRLYTRNAYDWTARFPAIAAAAARIAGVVFFIVRAVLALFPALALRYPIKKWAAMLSCSDKGSLLRGRKKAPPKSRARSNGWKSSRGRERTISAGQGLKGSTPAHILCANSFASRSDKCYKFCWY